LEINDKSSIAFTSQIDPWGTPEAIESVIPQEYINIIKDYIPIHEGTTPPNIEGTYFISPNVLLTDNVGYEPGKKFANEYVMFYDQTYNNTISMQSTQLLGDLSVGSGLFISGSGENFTVYFNEYSTYDDGSYLTQASIISGSVRNGYLYDYQYAFIVLDDYDVNGKYMDSGQYRILYDQDGYSEPTEWPLDTRSIKPGNGVSKHAKYNYHSYKNQKQHLGAAFDFYTLKSISRSRQILIPDTGCRNSTFEACSISLSSTAPYKASPTMGQSRPSALAAWTRN
jgi:hypothetical protein